MDLKNIFENYFKKLKIFKIQIQFLKKSNFRIIFFLFNGVTTKIMQYLEINNFEREID